MMAALDGFGFSANRTFLTVRQLARTGKQPAQQGELDECKHLSNRVWRRTAGAAMVAG
jgi:hypothetical protein